MLSLQGKEFLAMRFFNISKIKNDISSGQFTELEYYKYMFAWFAMYYLTSFPVAGVAKSELPYFQSVIGWLAISGVNILGIRKSFAANGGSRGIQFIGKFLALGWVLGIRGLLFAIPGYIAFCFIVGFAMALTGNVQSADEKLLGVMAEYGLYLFILGFSIWYYSRLCIHLRSLRDKN